MDAINAFFRLWFPLSWVVGELKEFFSLSIQWKTEEETHNQIGNVASLSFNIKNCGWNVWFSNKILRSEVKRKFNKSSREYRIHVMMVDIGHASVRNLFHLSSPYECLLRMSILSLYVKALVVGCNLHTIRLKSYKS